jgi:ribosomal silencing factor RsfS
MLHKIKWKEFASASGSVTSSDAWSSPITLSLTGDVTGNVSFDGTNNVSLTAVVGDDTHTHDTRYYTKAQDDGRFLGIAAKAVDTNLFDGLDSTAFIQKDVNSTNNADFNWTGRNVFEDQAVFNVVTIEGDLVVNGTTTTLNSANLTVDDKIVELGSITTPTDDTANGGGVLLHGSTNKTITWVKATNKWTFSHNIEAPNFTGTASNADLLDGVSSGSFLRSDIDDNLTSDIIVPTGNRDSGIFGTYDSTKTQHIWSMGTAYRNSATGASYGNLYGLAYKYNANGGGHAINVVSNGTETCSFGANIWSSGDIIAYSDRRVKENLEIIPNALDKISKLNGYTYDRTDVHNVTAEGDEIISAHNTSKRHVGLIAQELLEVLPEAVFGGPTNMEGSEDAHYSVAYGNVVALLIEAVKEQQIQIKELQYILALRDV